VTDGPHETVHRLRVRYCETDRMGVTHHGSYIDWFEEARTEWLRARGKSYRAWEEQGVFLQIVEVAVRYRRPTTYDDEVEILTRLTERGRVSITLEYDVRLAVSSALVATGMTKLACVDREGRLQRLPDWV
jgi:acyl-CoA thioester hydrolase